MRSEQTMPIFVSVATQTDGAIEAYFYDLSGSSGSSVSLTMSNLDLSSDESSDFLTRRRVMSSQTDLTLSDFDVGISHGSDDFDDDCDEGLDNSFNPYEVLISRSPDGSLYSNIGPDDVTSPCLLRKMEAGKVPLDGLNAEIQCQQFFELLRNKCNSHSERRCPKSSGPERPREILELVTRDVKEREGQAGEVCGLQRNQIGGRVVNRMVPKMGTKIDFTRPVTSPSSARVPCQNPLTPEMKCRQPITVETKCHQPITVEKSSTEKTPSSNHVVCFHDSRSPQWNLPGNGCTVSDPPSFYHSDSERSNIATPSSLLHLREWNSDGDAKNFSFPSSDDSGEQSPETRDALKHDDKKNALRQLYEQYADVMYTNEANLQHTIMVQQKLFQQQIASRIKTEEKQQIELKTLPNKQITRPGHHGLWVHLPGERPTPPPVEWVIKRRADGTRYITRRPVSTARGTKERTKVEDERKFTCAVAEERRCVATTTDDDAISEPKTGKYWTKEERRQHLEKARIQQRGKVVGHKAVQEVILSHDAPLAQGKKSKVKKEHNKVRSQGHAVTFQELLNAHGKVDASGRAENPLLSVITM